MYNPGREDGERRARQADESRRQTAEYNKRQAEERQRTNELDARNRAYNAGLYGNSDPGYNPSISSIANDENRRLYKSTNFWTNEFGKTKPVPDNNNYTPSNGESSGPNFESFTKWVLVLGGAWVFFSIMQVASLWSHPIVTIVFGIVLVIFLKIVHSFLNRPASNKVKKHQKEFIHQISTAKANDQIILTPTVITLQKEKKPIINTYVYEIQGEKKLLYEVRNLNASSTAQAFHH